MLWPSPLAPLATLLSPQHLGVDGKHPFHRHSPLGPYFLVTDQTSQDFSLPTCDISPAELEDQEKLSAQLQPSNMPLSRTAQDFAGTQDPSRKTAPWPFSQSKTLLSRQLQPAHRAGEQHGAAALHCKCTRHRLSISGSRSQLWASHSQCMRLEK